MEKWLNNHSVIRGPHYLFPSVTDQDKVSNEKKMIVGIKCYYIRAVVHVSVHSSLDPAKFGVSPQGIAKTNWAKPALQVCDAFMSTDTNAKISGLNISKYVTDVI